MKKFLLSVTAVMAIFILTSCGDDGLVKKDKNIGAERKNFIQTSEKQANDSIVKLDADIKEAMVWNLKQVKLGANKNKDTADEATLKLELVKKIRPAQKQLQDAKDLFAAAKQDRKGFEANLENSDLPEYDQYKAKMKSVLETLEKGISELKKASDDFQKEFKNLK